MSTNGVIARRTGPETFEGRYHHSDGYPSGLGAYLFHAYRGYFNHDLTAMLEYLIDAHPAGWSSIGGSGVDFSKTPGYVSDQNSLYQKDATGRADFSKPIPHGPICYCHGDRSEEGQLITQEHKDEWQWTYILDSAMRQMEVLQGGTSVAVVNLDGPEPSWDQIECGDNLEWCCHCAWKHFPELRGTSMDRLGAVKFLGTVPLELYDTCAFEISGVVYRTHGSGSSVERVSDGAPLWAEVLTPPPGHKPLIARGARAFRLHYAGLTVYESGDFLYPVYGYTKQGRQKQLPGVKPIYPPTLKDPLAVFTELRRKAAVAAGTSASSAQPNAFLELLSARKFREDE